MSTSIISYNKNQIKIKNLRKRFFAFSTLALLIIIAISFIAFGFHRDIIDQQKSIRKVNKLLLKQQSAIKQISTLGSFFDEDISDTEMEKMRAKVRFKVSKLKKATSELSSFILKSDSASIEDLETYLHQKSFKSNMKNYIQHVKKLLSDSSTSLEIKESIRYLSKDSADGDTEYLEELLSILDSEYKDGMKKLERVGILIILLCILEVFVVWFFLFRPLHSTVMNQNKQLLESALKVESAARSRTDFLANISHEIRTPMTAILGYAEVLQTDEKLDKDNVKKTVKIINQNATHLLSLLDEVLDVSKMESGKFEFLEQKVDLTNLLNEVYSLIHVKAREKKIDLNFNNTGNIPQFIMTDPKRLKQILFNIIGNAIKFTDTGSIDLEVYLETNKQLQFKISDTGCGIPKEKRELIFAPFEQAYTSANRQFSGTGLGLVLSRGLARKMGGDVQILSSELGKGTVFLITINPGEIGKHSLTSDFSTSVIKDESDYLEQDYNLSRKEILVVDDAKENARLFSIYLERAGAKVTILNDGYSVLELTQTKSFDLILLDLQMPGMDGYQVISELKKNGYSGHISALTAHAMAEEVEKTRKSGFDAHITKPIGSVELIKKVYSIIG